MKKVKKVMTVMDVINKEENKFSKIVLVTRHYSYLMGPILARYPDEHIAYARNYAELEHPSLFLCDKAGIEMGWKQGKKLARAKVKVSEIIGSEQGRGPDSGLRISEGHQVATGEWISMRIHPSVNYPKYNYETVLKVLREIGDPFVAQWLNYQHQDLVRSDTPGSFKGRITGFIDDLLSEKGVRIISTHFEIVTLVHGLYVDNTDLGSIDESWAPQKGGGVLIVKNFRENILAWDYDSEYNLSSESGNIFKKGPEIDFSDNDNH